MAATAKKSRKSSGKKKKTVEEPPPPPPSSSSSSSDSGSDSNSEDQGDDMKLTLEALDAMSDDSDDDNNDGDDIDMEEEDNEEGEGGIGDGEAEAAALRKMISDGKFDGLLKNAKKNKNTKDTKKVIGNGSDDESEGEEDDESGVYETANVDDGEYEEIEQNKEEDGEDEQEDEEESDEERYWMSDPATKVNESDDDDSSSDSDDEEAQQAKKTSATIAMEAALQMANRNLPWAESFTIVPPTPLPFNPSSSSTSDNNKKRKLNASYPEEEDEDEEEYVDIHDDLKREVAFYDNALESVTLAREQCESVGIPFTRPDDFFAEMVKSDDHMAKIKDRLIFETKKMEAVERRKSNKEQTAMAKERHAFRIAEKSKQKKEHMAALNDWKKNTERNRSNLGGKVNDWQDDEDQLRGMSGGVNKKRMAANKKYGFGDKRGGRFKQNDKRTLNDMSGFNARGGFGGIGQKSSGGKGKGKGKKRPGKRARDAKR